MTKDLLTEFQATEVKLCVHISDSEYEACRDDLLHLTISQTAEASDTEESTTYSQSGEYISLDTGLHPNISSIHPCSSW